MIASWLGLDVIAAILWTVIAWCAGVAFAVYRALSWVDRMHTWARTVTIIEEKEPTP